METDAALIWADGVVELHAIADVDVDITVVVHPRHAEGEDAVGLYEAFHETNAFKFWMLVIDGFDGLQNFAHGLQVFFFALVFGFERGENLFGFHTDIVFLVSIEKRPTQRFCLVFRCFSMGRPYLPVSWGGWGAVQMKIGCPKIIESF